PFDGLLCREDHPAPGDGEPDPHSADGPQRPRRPTLRDVRRVSRTAPTEARASSRPASPTGTADPGLGRRGLHDGPEIPARAKGGYLPSPLRPPEHRGDRRRGPPE